MNKQPYTFYWFTGDREVLHGTDAANALNEAGYGAGALRALDFYAKGDNHEYTWNNETREWVRITPVASQEAP